mgnify:CR=1 FL=1|tara:strand:+ start:393 stop:554 length:162 start_codon:yes stop_codon:yes gene_type:complete
MMRYIIPITVGVLYVAQGVYHLSKKEWGFACMWLAYGVANAGVCLAMAEGKDH